MDLAEPVRRVAADRPGDPALVTDAATLTFADLDARADRAAAGLQGLGLVPGDRLAVVAGNVVETVVALLGAFRAGLTAVPVNPGATTPELDHVLADSGARAAVAAPGVLPRLLPAAGPALEVVVATPAGGGAGTGPRVLPWDDALGADRTPAPAPPAADPAAPALLPYTSGTTGRPRGAMLPAAALLANQEQMRATRLDLGPGDRVLCVLPLFHIYALNVALLHPLACGAAVVLVDRAPADATLAAAARHGATVLVGVPTLYAAWSGTDGVDLPTARFGLSGAAGLPPSVLEGFTARFGVPLWEGYGLTETAPLLTTTAMGDAPVPGSVGRPVPGVALRLVDDVGREARAGDPGEVVVRGPNLFTGYWGDPAGTGQVLDADGWFRTGDIGYLDGEDLHLVDRATDLVVVNGFNVYPREVEEALLRHPDVTDAAVVGVPDAATGEAAHAFVVLRPGAAFDEPGLRAHAARLLARYKCPAAISVVDSLPHLPSGKVKRRELRSSS